MSERDRLRSECWRRAHGIMPRKPAQRPWLAEGISRSTLLPAAQAGAGGGRKAMCPRLSGAHNGARRVLRGETLARSRPMHGLEARVWGDYRGTGVARAFTHDSRFEVGLTAMADFG